MQTQHRVILNQSSPLTRLLALVIFLTLIVLGFIIAIPLLIIGAAVLLVALVYFKIKSLFRRAHEPGGLMDKRENVRVINRNE